MATLSVVDNFLSGMSNPDGFKSSAQKKLDFFLDVGTFRQLPNCRLLSFRQNEDKYDDDDLILSIRQKAIPSQEQEPNWHIQSGNYVGYIQTKGHSIEIKSRFSEPFLQRMLQAVNNVYLADIDGAQTTPIDYARFLLYTLFIQKLEKAFLLGLPKVYQIKHHHEAGLKGRVYIAGMIKRDMPYKGKLSSQQRVRAVDEAIISVLNIAVKRVFNEYKQAAQNIRHVSTALRQLNPKKLQKETMANALSSKALSNPIFAPYKQVLSLAKLIIEQQSVKPARSEKSKSYGFLVNVAELFELYVKSLLQKNFPDWSVDSPKIKLYKNQFYSRHIIPDIVMRKGNKVAVFDTKYKRMNYKGTNQNGMGDVDRSDFFQIHTYMSYYQSQPGIEFIGGGLLYPLSKPYDSNKCFSSQLLNEHQAWFCVDGIEIPQTLNSSDVVETGKSENQIADLICAERAFIARLKQRLEDAWND